MRKMILVSALALAVLVTFIPICNAEMANEGEASFISAYSAAGTPLPMGKERLQLNYEATGVVVETPADCPFHNASFRVLGSLHAIKGVYKDRGSVIYTLPNGDQVYATFKATGTLGKADRKNIGTFVGGTGKCTGIEGGFQYTAAGHFRPAKKGTGQGTVKGTFHWKIPVAKK
jgi:hypothetical protein